MQRITPYIPLTNMVIQCVMNGVGLIKSKRSFQNERSIISYEYL